MGKLAPTDRAIEARGLRDPEPPEKALALPEELLREHEPSPPPRAPTPAEIDEAAALVRRGPPTWRELYALTQIGNPIGPTIPEAVSILRRSRGAKEAIYAVARTGGELAIEVAGERFFAPLGDAPTTPLLNGIPIEGAIELCTGDLLVAGPRTLRVLPS